MADLKLDTASIRDVGTDLSRVASEFDGANAHSDRIAAAVGHDGLSETVKDFAHEWDDTRKAMVADIQTMAKAATAIADGFEQTDKQLATALNEPAQPQPQPQATAQHGSVAR